MRNLIRAAALLLALGAGSVRADCQGEVLSVADGDTLVLRCAGQALRVRLAQIDAPEYQQPYGRRARKELALLVQGQSVRLQEQGRDVYDRALGTVYVGELDVNREMVRRGYAWAYRRYLRDPQLLQDEAAAREQRLGLWNDPTPKPPWQFRPPPQQRY